MKMSKIMQLAHVTVTLYTLGYVKQKTEQEK